MTHCTCIELPLRSHGTRTLHSNCTCTALCTAFALHCLLLVHCLLKFDSTFVLGASPSIVPFRSVCASCSFPFVSCCLFFALMFAVAVSLFFLPQLVCLAPCPLFSVVCSLRLFTVPVFVCCAGFGFQRSGLLCFAAALYFLTAFCNRYCWCSGMSQRRTWISIVASAFSATLRISIVASTSCCHPTMPRRCDASLH